MNDKTAGGARAYVTNPNIPVSDKNPSDYVSDSLKSDLIGSNPILWQHWRSNFKEKCLRLFVVVVIIETM